MSQGFFFVFFCSRYFEFWLLSKLQDVGKVSQDKNEPKGRIVKNVVDQKN